MPHLRLAAAALSVIALAVISAGCGGSSTTSSASSTQPTTTASVANAGTSSGGGVAIVSAASTPKFGTIIVNSSGMALYDFQKDSGTKSACYGSCAKVWPPLITNGSPKAGGGAEASKLGTIKRTDGTIQVTYNGHPLYTYTADMSPGDVNGNGVTSFGGSWHALDSSGSAARGEAATGSGSTEATTTQSGGGYGY
jgi:predicted lipoprotein with Yx(FWY)xxD motif